MGTQGWVSYGLFSLPLFLPPRGLLKISPSPFLQSTYLPLPTFSLSTYLLPSYLPPFPIPIHTLSSLPSHRHHHQCALIPCSWCSRSSCSSLSLLMLLTLMFLMFSLSLLVFLVLVLDALAPTPSAPHSHS
jgi:hypothetical protein